VTNLSYGTSLCVHVPEFSLSDQQLAKAEAAIRVNRPLKCCLDWMRQRKTMQGPIL